MTEIQACPFCGGPAELTGHKAPEFWVRCPGCKASTEAFGDQERAIAAWNRRYTFRSVPEVLANRMGATFEPAKYSAAWISKEIGERAWLRLRDCSICGGELGYVVNKDSVWFRSDCECTSYHTPDRRSSFDEIAQLLAHQPSDEGRDVLMARMLDK